MFKKTLLALAIAGAFGLSGSPAIADDEPVVEIGEGITASAAAFDDNYDSIELAAANDIDGAEAVGSTSGASGSGTLSFSSDGRHDIQHASVTEEAYLVPAPLAANHGSRYWKVDVSASELDELDRLATENVYVMMPIEDAIVDPQLALTSGAEVYAKLGESSEAESMGL